VTARRARQGGSSSRQPTLWLGQRRNYSRQFMCVSSNKTVLRHAKQKSLNSWLHSHFIG